MSEEVKFKAIFKGEEKEFKVNYPTVAVLQESQKVFNRYAKIAADSGAFLREKLEDIMREQNLWNDEKQAELEKLQAELQQADYSLKKGGIRRQQAKEICLRIIDIKSEIAKLLSDKSRLDALTIQGQADNAKFQYLVSACLVYLDGSRVLANMDEYFQYAAEPAVFQAAQKLAELMTGINYDEADNIEYKVLKQLKYVDDKLRLIDSAGRLVDRDGRLIDEEGRFINENGEFVDRAGRLVDKNGDFIIEFSPFLDDDGNPIEEEKEKVEEETVTPES